MVTESQKRELTQMKYVIFAGLSHGVRLLQKTTLPWLANTKVNMAFDWLSNFLTSDHASGVFLRDLTP